ncbi:MAG: FAD-binding oxidoreductase [Chloroflexota bacterium]|nr:FAD-binding oxidoreductase [Chloroflexota bacterium]
MVTATRVTSDQIDGLRGQIHGEVIQPGDANYDEARTLYNAMIDKRPALVARCVDAADVIAAVGFARSAGLDVAIRGGGHNVAGNAMSDGGLTIDLSRMNGVRVDPVRRTARVEGGALWRDVDHATHAFGLATPTGIIGTTGVAGLTLGGGFGHLSRSLGLSCDNLLSADVVTASGELVTASAEEHPDLFWALRGGGGNFGVVTSFEFRLHPVSTVLAGPIFYDVKHTEHLLRTYRDFMRSIPDQMSAFFSFHQGPPAPFIPEHLHFVPMTTIMVCYNGPIEQGEQLLRPLREAAPALVDLVGPMPMPAVNTMFDPIYAPGLQHYWKADFIPTLTDEMIPIHAEHGPNVPSLQSTMHLYPQTGAIQRVGKDETAYNFRDVEYIHNIVAIDADPANMPRNMAWMQAYWAALHPYSSDGSYVNFMMADEGQDRVHKTYGENYDRLARIKREYDSENLFHLNQNIRPA